MYDDSIGTQSQKQTKLQGLRIARREICKLSNLQNAMQKLAKIVPSKNPHTYQLANNEICVENPARKPKDCRFRQTFFWVLPRARKIQTTFALGHLWQFWSFSDVNSRALSHEKANGTRLLSFWANLTSRVLEPQCFKSYQASVAAVDLAHVRLSTHIARTASAANKHHL